MKRSRKRSSRARVLAAFKRESERELSELIRRRLDLPVEKRLNFLRVRRPGGGSYLQSTKLRSAQARFLAGGPQKSAC